MTQERCKTHEKKSCAKCQIDVPQNTPNRGYMFMELASESVSEIVENVVEALTYMASDLSSCSSDSGSLGDCSFD